MTLRILFVGLQQKGSSLALALTEAGVDATMVGFDYDKRAARAAKDSGTVSEVVSNPYKAASNADVVVVTLPAGEADEYLHDVVDRLKPGSVVLDGSPLKASSLRWAAENMTEAHYIGLALVVQYDGLFNLQADYEQARADLYKDGLFGLVIPADTPERAINITVNIASSIGSHPFFIDAAEMEAITTLTDTLPAALSLALLQTAADSRGWPDIQRLAGRRFVAATHNLAEGDPEALADKFMDNNRSLVVHLDQVITQLQELRQALDEGEQKALTGAIKRALKQRQSWLARRERADWEAEEMGRSQVSTTGLMGNLFGFDPGKRKRD